MFEDLKNNQLHTETKKEFADLMEILEGNLSKKMLVAFVKEVRNKMCALKSREELYNEACAFAINKFEYGDHPYGHGANGECIVGDRDYEFRRLLEAEKRKVRQLLELPESELEKLYKKYPNLKVQLERAKTDILKDPEPMIIAINGINTEMLRGV